MGEPGTGAAGVPSWRDGSALALVLGNLVPLAGVLFFEWGLVLTMFVFWIDNVMVGLWTVPKVYLATNTKDESDEPATIVDRVWNTIFFFIFYGAFTAFHGVVVIGLFGTQPTPHGRRGPTEEELAQMLPAEALWVAVLTLFATRGVELYLDFLRPRAYETSSYKEAAGGAFGRMFLLHVVLIGGGALALYLRSPIAALVLLVVLKTLGDLIVHVLRRRPEQDER
jgi:hypothetical protein